MVIYIKKLLLFICLFFLFNTLEIDSNSNKVIIYDKNEIYEENDYLIYFKNASSKELNNILKILNIEVLSYIIDGKKYYANSVDELTNKFLKNKNDIEKLYYDEYGINIEAIYVKCTNNELIKLYNLLPFY